MPRWRRRQLKRARKQALKLALKPLVSEPINGIRVQSTDGTIQTWILPLNKSSPLPDVPYWDGTGDHPPGDAFWTTMEINTSFMQCHVCNTVWQEPEVHTQESCDLTITREVLET